MSFFHQRSNCLIFNSVHNDAFDFSMLFFLFFTKVDVIFIRWKYLVPFPVIICKDDKFDVLTVTLKFLE